MIDCQRSGTVPARSGPVACMETAIMHAEPSQLLGPHDFHGTLSLEMMPGRL